MTYENKRLGLPLLQTKAESSHQDICDNSHDWYVEVWCVDLIAWLHMLILVVSHTPVLEFSTINSGIYIFSTTCGNIVRIGTLMLSAPKDIPYIHNNFAVQCQRMYCTSIIISPFSAI